jgi:hypothetical protein
MKAKLKPSCKTRPTTLPLGQKRGGSPLLGGIHTTGFFGLLAFTRQCPLLPVKPAVGRLLSSKNESSKICLKTMLQSTPINLAK